MPLFDTERREQVSVNRRKFFPNALKMKRRAYHGFGKPIAIHKLGYGGTHDFLFLQRSRLIGIPERARMSATKLERPQATCIGIRRLFRASIPVIHV